MDKSHGFHRQRRDANFPVCAWPKLESHLYSWSREETKHSAAMCLQRRSCLGAGLMLSVCNQFPSRFSFVFGVGIKDSEAEEMGCIGNQRGPMVLSPSGLC